MSRQTRNIIVGITGASGAVYARRIIEELAAGGWKLHIIVSNNGRDVVNSELGLNSSDGDYVSALIPPAVSREGVYFYDPSDMNARIASGSFKCCGMVIIPCSMSTLASIATGSGRNLIHRAADVTLKERRPLVIVPRETPLNAIHLRNMLTLCEAGASILPAMPAFYTNPRTIDDLVNFIVGRCLDMLGISHDLYRPWGSQ